MNNKLVSFLAVLIIISVTASACGGGKIIKSDLERITDPQIPAENITQVVAGNTSFAFDVYHAVRTDQENLVFSPFSISLAFAMTYVGAQGATAGQMADVLHYTLPGDHFHPAFNALDLELASRPDQAVNVDEEERFELSIANSLWGQVEWSFLPEFLDLLAANYGAGMRLVDFQKSTESARRQINDWVSDQTHKRIQDIIPPGVLDPSTRLVLANAIYYKATWEFEFDPNETSDALFHLLNDDTVTVDMMEMENGKTFSYASGDGWQAIALPYKGRLTEMVIILPERGYFDAVVSSLNGDRINEIVSELQPRDVLLRMPKFTFETSLGLKDTLMDLGIVDAFDPDLADFSGMDGRRDLYIGNALHKAFIAVDEKGTEAAAATVVIMMMASLPMSDIELTIDRPFFYLIRDVPSGTILFMGHVVDPR